MTPTVWTTRRKVLGNVVPALVWLPVMGAGIAVMVVRAQILGLGLDLVAAATVLGWFALNQFGSYYNGQMRRQLERILKAQGEDLSGDPNFVGFATPRYSSLLDAHEDVGFLRLMPDRLRFVSETRTVEVMRSDVAGARFRPNVHTMVGLGRWVSVEGVSGGKPIRLLVEPRDRITMLGNLRQGKRLLARIRKWLKETEALAPKPPAKATKTR